MAFVNFTGNIGKIYFYYLKGRKKLFFNFQKKLFFYLNFYFLLKLG
jgi:hypothetical protein